MEHANDLADEFSKFDDIFTLTEEEDSLDDNETSETQTQTA